MIEYTGYMENWRLHQIKKGFDNIFIGTRSPNQATISIGSLWKTMDDVYVNKNDHKRVRITIEELE